MKVLVITECLKGRVRDVTLELISAAKEIGNTVIVALISNVADELTEQVNIEGVAEIIKVKVAAAEFESDTNQHAVEAIVNTHKPNVVLFGFTVNAMACAAGLAVKQEMGFASDVFSLRKDGTELIAERSFYGGKVTAELTFPDFNSVILMLQPGAWAAAKGRGNATISNLITDVPKTRTRQQEIKELPDDNSEDISSAEFLLCIGRGVDNRESVLRFEQLADKMGASLAVSRPPVDAGWVSRHLLVGQSGKTVKPKVYLSFGISGAVQHTAGMKNSDTVIAINKDPEASIFSIADYGAVADLYEVSDELDKLY